MAWPVTRADTFKPTSAAWNEIVNALSQWGGNVNAGGYTLSNVVLSLSSLNIVNSSNPALTTTCDGGKMRNTSTAPVIEWYETGGPTDAKLWKTYADGGVLSYTTANDADTAANIWLNVIRSGYKVTAATFACSVTATRGDYDGAVNAIPGVPLSASQIYNLVNSTGEHGLFVSNTWAAEPTYVFAAGSTNIGVFGGWKEFFSVRGNGYIYMPVLPSSASGLAAGTLWKDGSGFVRVA